MSIRRLKVYPKPGTYNYSQPDVPEMRIGGVWLSKLGYSVGDHIELTIEEEQITIRRVTVEESEIKRKR